MLRDAPKTMKQTALLQQETTGEGFPLVVLHGLFGDADNFRSVLSPVEAHFQVIRLDLPGHGQSPTLPTLSIEALADTVSQHLQTIGVTHFHLLGHSLGGKVAMQIAGNHNTLQIEKLLVIDIAPRLYPPHHTHILKALKSVTLNESTTRSGADKQLSEAIDDKGVRAFLLKALYRKPTGGYGWRFDLDGIISSYDEIRQAPTFANTVAAPTLFVKGGNSDYIGPQDEQPIRTHFTQPSFKEIMGTGHWLHAEKPDVFASICLKFLQP